MIVKRAFLILLGILLIMAPVTAYYASSVIFSPSDSTKDWIIADVGQQNVLKLVASNSTFGPVKNAPVAFTLDNPLLGTISPKNTQTDNLGEATCTFTVNSTHPYSGTATITADVISSDVATYHTPGTWAQKIDHNVPYKAVFVYPIEAGVESVIPVKISIFDRWDNRVDDKRPEPLHNITLHVNGPSPLNNCGFTDFGLVHDKKFDLDSNGEVTISITPATKPGWHYILMDIMGSIPEQMKLFNTVANGAPFSMEQTFSPDGNPYATVLADGTSRFNFFYTLYDKFGNPTRDQWLWINTSVPGEEIFNKTIDNGQIWSWYGPKSYTGMFTITATPAGNSSLQLSKVVRFYNTAPTGLDLSANPQSMPSRDANPLISSDLSAKVTDIMGNGVSGQIVTFTFHDITSTPATATVTKAPSFSSTITLLTTSATTDSDGYATVKFYPGAYATSNQPGYLQAVTGTAIVTASWNATQKDEKVIWKNYPYLSAVVAVNPQQVKVGDTVDVSLKLNGDGWALYQYPIDVNLVLDRSGSMGYNIAGTSGTPTRLSIAKTAATNFIGNMSVARDRLGLYSYGYATDVTHNAVLQSPFGPVTTAVASLSANGATATRKAVKLAIDDMIANPNANTKAVRALIVMTDGDWNNEGSPAAHGTGWPDGNPDYTFSGSTLEPNNYRYYPGLGGTLTPYIVSGVTRYKCTDGEFTNQNLSVYAKNNNIRLYFIFFAGTPDPTAKSTLQKMAEATGGFYQQATSAAELNGAYDKIAGSLKTEAGVDTRASMDFGSLIVNGNATVPGDSIFDYVGDPIVASPVKGVDFPTIQPGSTMLDKYNKTPGGTINKHLIPGFDVSSGSPFTDIGPIIINQTSYWNDPAHPQQLAFNIGTVNINETWETNFRLRVLEEGNILVFGPQSKVCFTNGEAGPSCMTLPNLSLSSSMNPLNLGLSATTISVTGLTRTDTGPVKSTLPVTWTTVYNGDKVITEEVSYIHDNDPPVKFDVKIIDPTAGPIPIMGSTLTMDKLPSGGYKIQVHAFTVDASDTKECGLYSYTTQGRAFIKIE